MLTDCNNSQPFRTVNCVVDSLYLRVLRQGVQSNYLKQQVPIWRKFKKEYDQDTKPYLVRLPGLGTFELKPFGQKPYEFVFVNKDVGNIYIWNPDRWSTAYSSQTGQFLVDFRSKYLQFYGLEGVRQFVERLAKAFVLKLSFTMAMGWERISRVDLATDTQLPKAPTWSDLPRYVSRSRKNQGYSDSIQADLDQARDLLRSLKKSPPPKGNKGGANYNLSAEEFDLVKRVLDSVSVPGDGDAELSSVVYQKDLQSIYFGRLASMLLCTRYDKRASLKVHKKEYLEGIWKSNGWDGKSDVWRTEFKLKSAFLRQAGTMLVTGEQVRDLRDFKTFCRFIPRVWQYLTHEWLRLTDPNPDDTNCTRWQTSEEWTFVQNAFYSNEAVRRYKPPKAPIDEQLRAQMCGVALTMAALKANSDYDGEIALEVANHLMEFFSKDDFYDRLSERRGRLGCDDFTFAALADQLRAERMLEGEGS